MEEIFKLLLVDDEPMVRRSMEKSLFRAGFDVETASNCSEGLATFEAVQASEKPFDLAILDLNMPGFEGTAKSGAGLELLSKLIEHQADLPVIVLTAYDEIGKAKEAINRGAQAYLVKGREKGLIDLINDILS